LGCLTGKSGSCVAIKTSLMRVFVISQTGE